MATDLMINDCGDLAIDNGDAVLVSGADQVRQAWIIHMNTFLGEWFLDQSIGLPYFQEIFTKRISEERLKQIFTDETLSVPGVTKVTNVIVGTIDLSNRSVDMQVYADIEGEENALLTYTCVIPSGGC